QTGEGFAVCDGNDIRVYDAPAPDPDDATGAETPTEPSLVERAGTPVAPKPREVLSPIYRLGPAEGTQPAGRWRPPFALTPDGRGLLVRRPRNRVQLWDVATGSHAGEWSWRVESLAGPPG